MPESRYRGPPTTLGNMRQKWRGGAGSPQVSSQYANIAERIQILPKTAGAPAIFREVTSTGF
jgi:hypothetical protein